MLLNDWLIEERYYSKVNEANGMQAEFSLNSVLQRELLFTDRDIPSVINYLVEEYRHEEEIQQHGLRKRFIVNFEKEHSEDDCDILICRAAERGA